MTIILLAIIGFLSIIGAVLLIISFRKDFNNLTKLQKIAIILVVIGILTPFFFGLIASAFGQDLLV